MILPTLPVRAHGEAIDVRPAAGRSQSALPVLLALLTFSAIAFFRNSYAFSYPVLYGEDAYWLGLIAQNGFWHALLHGRPEFSVSALVALLQVAWLATRALFQSDISALPQMIAVVTSLVFGFTATLPLLCLRDRLHPGFCWLIGFAIALLPVGQDGYEIFGRVLNLGFYMPVIAQFVLFALLYRRTPPWAALLLHAAALGLMWSFPVVIGQYLVFLAFDALLRLADGEPFVLRLLAHLAVLVLGVFALDPIVLTTAGGIPLPFRPENLVEFAVARSTLFPILAPVYRSLNDAVTLLVLLALLGSAAVYFRRFDRGAIGLLDYRVFLLLNFGVMWAATLVMRRGLTSILDNYHTSFPDRYFTGVNIMFLTAWMAFALSHPSAAYRRFAAGGFVALIVCWVATVPTFQRTMTPAEQRDLGTFRDTICDTATGRGVVLPSPLPDLVAVATYPSGPPDYPWRLPIERRIFERTVEAQCR